MAHQFLTLEGPDDSLPRRPRSMIDTLMALGAISPAAISASAAAARRAAAVASHAAKTEAAEEQGYREYTAGGASKHSEREELWKPAEYDLSDKTPSIFSNYGIEGIEEYTERELGEVALLGLISEGFLPQVPIDEDDLHMLGELASYALLSCEPDCSLGADDEELAWGWKNIRRAFTPPRSIRQTFSSAFKAVSKVHVTRLARPFAKFAKKTFGTKFKKFAKKGLRYAGAWYTLPLTMFGGAKIRNKAFGLKGGEMRTFDAAAKVGRIAAIATLAVVGGPAIAGSMGKFAGGGMSKYLASAGGKSFLGQSVGGKIGSVMIKDTIKNQIMRVVKDSGGKLVGSVINKNQVPPEVYNDLPDNTPVPTLVAQEDVPQPAYVAGTGGINPGGDLINPKQYGELAPYPEQAREQSMSDIAETRLIPEDRAAFMNPSQARKLERVVSDDEVPLRELIARSQRTAGADTNGDELETSGGEPSLGSIIRENRRRKLRLQIQRDRAQRRI